MPNVGLAAPFSTFWSIWQSLGVFDESSASQGRPTSRLFQATIQRNRRQTLHQVVLEPIPDVEDGGKKTKAGSGLIVPLTAVINIGMVPYLITYWYGTIPYHTTLQLLESQSWCRSNPFMFPKKQRVGKGLQKPRYFGLLNGLNQQPRFTVRQKIKSKNECPH